MADGERILSYLPAAYARADASGALRDLAGALEALFFMDPAGDPPLPGYERRLEALPALFAPMGAVEGLEPGQTPADRLGWLAEWLGFAPHRLLAPERLRAVLAAIVPLNARRGTRDYLATLLRLAFAEDVAHIVIDDRRRSGLTISADRPPAIGVDTRLGTTPPFLFDVTVTFAPAYVAAITAADARADRDRLHALIDYAKPAHTRYRLWSNLP